jgi:hypothetical protein
MNNPGEALLRLEGTWKGHDISIYRFIFNKIQIRIPPFLLFLCFQ